MLYPLSYRGGVGRNSIVSSARVVPKAHRRTPYRKVLIGIQHKSRYEGLPLGLPYSLSYRGEASNDSRLRTAA